MTIKIYPVCLAGMLLTGCGGSDKPVVETVAPEGQYLSGGVSCGTSLVSSTNSDTNSNPVNAGGEVDCSAELNTDLPGPGIASTGIGSVRLGERELPISTAMIDISFRDAQRDTMELDLTLHDGSIRTLEQQSTAGNVTTTRVDWGFYDSTVVIVMELLHAGSETFTGGSFNVIAGETPAEINTVYEPVVFIDKRSDGQVTDADELLEVASGNVNITGESPDWSVSLDFTLVDGSSMTGTFTGSLYELPGGG